MLAARDQLKGFTVKSATFFLAVGATLISSVAAAGSSYVLSDGTNRAPAMTLHCVSAGGVAVPCGTNAYPLVVSAPLGASSSANQTLQITAEQASALGIGSINDSAFAGGPGSVIALLKALWGSSLAGVPALPAGGTLVSRTTSLVAATSTTVFPVNPQRRYFSFQVPQGSGVWINLMGGTAAPNAADCAYFAAGTFYESGQFINRGAIAVYAPVGVMFSAWEN